MNRRDLLKLLLATPAAMALDYEQLLWVPKPIVTVPGPTRALAVGDFLYMHPRDGRLTLDGANGTRPCVGFVRNISEDWKQVNGSDVNLVVTGDARSVSPSGSGIDLVLTDGAMALGEGGPFLGIVRIPANLMNFDRVTLDATRMMSL